MSDSRSKPSGSTLPGMFAATPPKAALDALLNSAAGGNPVRRALWLDELDRRLRPCLSPSLAAHARLANIDGGKLVYLVDSPVWHAKVRLASSELLDAARSIGLDVTTVVVKTTMHVSTPTPPAITSTAPLSASAPEGLRDALMALREPGTTTEEVGPDCPPKTRDRV